MCIDWLKQALISVNFGHAGRFLKLPMCYVFCSLLMDVQFPIVDTSPSTSLLWKFVSCQITTSPYLYKVALRFEKKDILRSLSKLWSWWLGNSNACQQSIWLAVWSGYHQILRNNIFFLRLCSNVFIWIINWTNFGFIWYMYVVFKAKSFKKREFCKQC